MPPNSSLMCRKIKAAPRSDRHLKGTNLFSILALPAKDLERSEETLPKGLWCPKVMLRPY